MSCPICGKPATPAYRPFCSRRCADVDLGRWLTEGYRVPAETEDAAEDAIPDDTPPKPH
ncbi:DNA gyrase inhibitor YacG [Tabrizicola sp.]|uniref:DNA gyrase inhibitor YacG n=1 Tax=Tabrizicola sp. TaxID=2005166 RepID=UPI002FDD54C8